MSGKPLVSVIIPFLNSENFIQEAIESVFVQTYDNWELLLIDDGSNDASTAIALEYVGRSLRVSYLEHDDHQNRGVCASRNLGIRNAKGEFIALLDADDVWLPHKLEQQVAILDSEPKAAMVYGTSQYWHSWTGKPEDIRRDFVPELGVQPDTLMRPPILLTLALEGKAPTPPPSDILLRRQIIEHIGGFEEAWRGMYQLYEDQAFLAKIYVKASVFVAGECWLRYRLHPDSCCALIEKAGNHDTVRLFYLNWLEKHLSAQSVEDTELWKALQQALKPHQHPAVPVEIEEVTLVPLDRELLWGGYIDQPKPGSQSSGHMVDIWGWVLGRNSPAVAVEVVHDGAVIQRVPVQGYRPDLTRGFPHVPEAERAGFRTSVSVQGMSELALQVQAVLQDQRRVPLGSIRARRRWRDETDGADAALVSVIIPCYNQAHFLTEAIESVLAQTYPHFQIIVVNDGSTDNTEAVAARYPGVRCLGQKNQGLSAARNTGLRQSNGRFLVFLDADDRLLPDALAVGLAHFQNHPDAAFVAGHCKYIASNGIPLPTPPQSCVEREHYLALLHENYIWTPALVMFKRTALKTVGGFNSAVNAAADYDLYLRMARNFPVYCHDKIVAEYRQHGANMSRSAALMLTAILDVLRSQWGYVQDNGQYAEGYKRGRRSAQEYYGEQVITEVYTQISQREWKQALHGMQVLCKYYPQGLEAIVSPELLPLVQLETLQQQIAILTTAKDAAQEQVITLQQVIDQQAEQLKALTAQVARLASREADLQARLLATRQELQCAHPCRGSVSN